MRLLWSERPADMRAGFSGKAGDLMEMLSGGTWSMGERFDYFIEPRRSISGGIQYVLEQQVPDAPDGSTHGQILRRATGSVEWLQLIAQRWEDKG